MSEASGRPAPSEEDLKVIAKLATEHRLLVLMIPDSLSEKFCGRLTTWANYCLDTGLLPPLPMPVTKKGNALHCPYCAVPVRSGKPIDHDAHDSDCVWRMAIERWAMNQERVESLSE